MKKKKIWIWNHYATDMYKNKGGRHFWFAEQLLKSGYNPTIFCANTFHNKKEYLNTGNKKYIIKNLNQIPFVFVKTKVALGNGIDRVKNMLFFYKNIFYVSKSYIKLDEKPSIILASSVHPLTMVAGIKVAKKLKIPCICEIRDLWPEAIFSFNKAKENTLLGKLLVKGEHWIYKNANLLIFTKEGDIDYIKEKKWNLENDGDIDLKKCHYINNGVDLKKYNELRNSIKINDIDLEKQQFNVVYTGAIRPVNDIDKILDTAKILKDKKDINFLIYGDGNQKDRLEERIKKENITNVKLKGFISKEKIPYVLSKSSINLLNYSQSQYNWSRGNSSNKLFEYMASGKPIISTVKMGYCILKQYKCGISSEDSTAEGLATAILKIYNMSKKEYEEMGKNGLIGVKDFDFEVLTKKLIKCIEKVI